jgi:hypothetical protein
MLAMMNNVVTVVKLIAFLTVTAVPVGAGETIEEARSAADESQNLSKSGLPVVHGRYRQESIHTNSHHLCFGCESRGRFAL